MPTIFTDAADDRLTPFRALKQTNETRGGRWCVLEGDKLFERAVAAGWPLLAAVTSERWIERIRPLVSENVPLYVLPHADVERLVGFNFHHGVLAAAVRPPSLTAEVLLAGGGRRFVVCNAVRDPTNLGAIARSAAAFGWDGLIVGPSTPDPLSRRVLRTSMGAVLRLPIGYATDDGDLPRKWQSRFELISAAGTLGDDSRSFDDWPPPARVALWLGNEDEGLPAAIANACAVRLRIPISSEVDSLNVAVAAGILLQRLGIDRTLVNGIP